MSDEEDDGIIPQCAVFQDEQRRTCIRLSCSKKGVKFIPMDSSGLVIQELPNKEFEMRYTRHLADYSVKVAASSYLAASWLPIDGDAKRKLQKLSGIEETVKPIDFENKESVMTEEAKEKSVKQEKVKVKVSKGAKPAKVAAPKADAKAVKVEAPKVDAKPAKANGKAKTTGKAAAKAAAKPAKPAKKGKGEADSDTTVYMLADPDNPRKGATGIAVAMALKLKTFTRAKLIEAMTKNNDWDERGAKNEINYCIKKGVLVATK